MRYTLIKKEFRQLLPVAILIIIFFTAQLIYNPVSGRLDEDSSSKISGYLEPDSQVSSSIVLIILCLMTSFSLFPREYDDRTIEYLYSLPISRNAVFFSKFIVALSILYGAMLLGCLADYLLQLFNKQPFSGTQFNLRTDRLFSDVCIYIYHDVLWSVALFFQAVRDPYPWSVLDYDIYIQRSFPVF